jgi:hypothetical protein
VQVWSHENATSGRTVTTWILFGSKLKLITYFNPWDDWIIEAIILYDQL